MSVFFILCSALIVGYNVEGYSGKPENIRYYLKHIVGGAAMQNNSGFCTVGFVVSFVSQDDVINGIVTAGHCIDNLKSVRITSAKVYGNTDRIGNPYINLLDNIDIGLVKLYDQEYNFRVGSIAKPIFENTRNMPIKSQTARYSNLLNLDSDYFRIIDWHNPKEKQIVYKLGQKTGLTKGIVLDSCAYPRISYKDDKIIEYNCMMEYSIYDAKGDSGGPVFSIVEGNDIILHGIHFANNTFIPIETIVQRLFTNNNVKLSDVWISVNDGDDIF